ncbi:uncharacterized protein FIBRA_08151 [Fibroporia radiculosa]|uniref:Glucose-methanol-choline oxidoreductase N-terminal domain-containing protein n=1 Tax=Fibroporia radiculosa TaxID=599839 RepID=J4GGM6_9APHY|nr:uncharacterized protein FIBRA_08151 [Fibroporia radiculosa]CCM05913.1 predicted protein [Fibroporia radiculosa]
MVNDIVTEADIVVAGGGASGCVLASRLAAADPSLTVLILEAGPATRDDLSHIQPARFLSHLVPGSRTVKIYVGEESADLGGRPAIVPCGQCLGGGSSVNAAMYTRPSASDYDDWETVYGNDGWGSNSLIPLLRKMETYQLKSHSDTHGSSGPLKISQGGYFTNLGEQFLDVAAKYDKTRSVTDDPNGMRESSINVYGRWQKYIDVESGRRSDVPHNYIYNHDFPNLHIMTGNHVKRVVFEDNRAVGVEYVSSGAQVVRLARANRLVVVSAGAFGSPAILERSGVGKRSLITGLGIPIISDLPGVGENYQDHIITFAQYHVAEDAETLDNFMRGDSLEIEKWTAQWEKDGSGFIAHNSIDAGVKLRPSTAELEAIGPAFSQRWSEYFAHAPDKPLILRYLGGQPADPGRKYLTMGCYVQYPNSAGYTHINSAHDVDGAPTFNPRYLSGADDVALLRWGYKFCREIARRMPSYRGEFVAGHPIFPQNSQAACHPEGSPTAVSDPNIQYMEEDNKAIDEYTRSGVTTIWHSMGTCAMKAREMGGVVDSQLNVYGVERLKVADMSIAPANVSANTYSTAVVIGEKAATIILKDLNIGV